MAEGRATHNLKLMSKWFEEGSNSEATTLDISLCIIHTVHFCQSDTKVANNDRYTRGKLLYRVRGEENSPLCSCKVWRVAPLLKSRE